MISFRASMNLSVLGLVAAVAMGCSGETGTNTGAESVQASQASVTGDEADTSSAKPTRAAFAHHRPHGGPDFLIGAALHENLNLTDAQKASIEALRKANEPERPAFDSARAKALAAQIRSGKVELTAPDKSAFEEKKAERIAASAKTLTKLHDILTPAQRGALVEAVTKRMEQGPMRGHHDANDANDAKAEGRRPNARRHHRGEGRGPFEMLADLDLTQAQKDAIHAKLEADKPAEPSEQERAAMKQNFETMRTQMKARLETFANDAFDATALATPPAPPEGMQDRMKHGPKGNMLAIVTSVLTAEQRERLAQRIEQGPKVGPRVAPAAIEEAPAQ